MAEPRLLLTGGSGLLGRHLRPLLPGMLSPTSAEFDITDAVGMERYADAALPGDAPTTLVHAAAFTRTHETAARAIEALEKNIIGTGNVARLCVRRGWRLIYISTDYVFRGDRGAYREDDEVSPCNAYAWSKLGGECAVRLCPDALIVRTSFGPAPFPFDGAFVDQWTSKVPVAAAAEKLVPLILSDQTGVIHLGAPRRSVYDYAVAISPGKSIAPRSTADSPYTFPKDTSLDCSKYDGLFAD